MITQEDVREVANSIGQEITQEQVEEVIATYTGQSYNTNLSWEMAVEQIINDILYA